MQALTRQAQALHALATGNARAQALLDPCLNRLPSTEELQAQLGRDLLFHPLQTLFKCSK